MTQPETLRLSIRSTPLLVLGCLILALATVRTIGMVPSSPRSFPKDFSSLEHSESSNSKNCGATKNDRRQDIPYNGTYQPAPVEAYIDNHMHVLGLDAVVPAMAPTCHIWNDNTTTPFHGALHAFLKELERYQRAVQAFPSFGGDLRLDVTNTNNSVCDNLKLQNTFYDNKKDPVDGIQGFFRGSGQLSLTRAGWTEPLLPSMRHPKLCTEGKSFGRGNFMRNMMRTDYIVHDFHALCQRLHPHSRIVFVDAGASLTFHGQHHASPVMTLLDLYRQFGFYFDHIYAYEQTPAESPAHVHDRVPDHLQAAYHWINVGVTDDINNHKRNPFQMLLDHYNEDDIIIVKLDIDTPLLEKALVEQLVADPRLGTLVDHFYFEMHVNQQEMAANWGFAAMENSSNTGDMRDTVANALQIFQQLREQGIAAHFWV